jgi:hypothetical protein
VDDEETLSGSSPQLQVFSNAAATSFWARARSPSGAPDLLDTPLGSQVTFDITQTFRKDEENATLTFTLTAVELEASDPLPGAPSNDGLWAVLAIYVDGLQDGTPFFHFEDIERLSGTGLDWVYTHQSGPLALEVTEGGEDQLSITLALPQPYEGVIDLSSIDPTETFTIYYTITADVVDTKQEDSRISVYARDPIDPESGSFFTYSGLTAIPAPEPGNTLLLATGAAVLLLAGRRRRGSKAAATVGACVSA